ncbi:MAG: hypothetical protein VKK59_04895 [Vampirovibrionales bacterium]|nr:hypothetical protein [Vampirovibrionales bacterium]
MMLHSRPLMGLPVPSAYFRAFCLFLMLGMTLVGGGFLTARATDAVPHPLQARQASLHAHSSAGSKKSSAGAATSSQSPLASIKATPVLPKTASESPARTSHASKCIDWHALNLSDEQEIAIDGLERQWQQMFSQVYPKLRSDQQTLQGLLQSQQASENQVMLLQARIHDQQDRLRREAIRTFMKKKSYLSSSQQAQLHAMMRTNGLMNMPATPSFGQ